MNEKVKQTILECHNQILLDKKISLLSNPDMLLTRQNGIDSLGIVTLVIMIEEKLNLDLDEKLTDIRNAKTISDLIKIVQEVMNYEEN